jgi:hypothetical protein
MRQASNRRSPEIEVAGEPRSFASPQQRNKLGVNKGFHKSKQQKWVNSRLLASQGTGCFAAQFSPNMVANRSTGDRMKTPGPSNGTQHVNLGMVTGTAGSKFRPEIVKGIHTLDQRPVGVLAGHSKMPT